MTFAGPGVMLDDTGNGGRVAPGIEGITGSRADGGRMGVIHLGDGDHGGVAAGSEGSHFLLGQGFRFPGEVDAGDVDPGGAHGAVKRAGGIKDGGGEAGMVPLELGALGGGEKGIAPGDRL